MSSSDTFTILYFAAAADCTGKESEELSGPMPVGDLFGCLELMYLDITKTILHSCLVSVNGEYVDVADKTLQIKVGDEVAIIPPVSSG